MKRWVVPFLLCSVFILTYHIAIVKPQQAQLATVIAIFNDVWDKAGSRLMITPWAGAQQDVETDITILNDVWDKENHRLRTSAEAGGGGTNEFEDLNGGTNQGQALVVGDGSTLSATGTGTIAATSSAVASALAVDPAACSAGLYGNDTTAAGALVCAQVQFSQLGGAASDAQIPNLASLSTGLTPSKCVETDGTGALVSSADVCGVGGGGGAPTSAAYVTTQAEAGLSAEVNLGALTTGVLRQSVSGGVATIASAELSGDVTTSGSNAVTIASNAVSFSKMADIATQTLIGRNTAGTGDPEALSASTVKTILSLNNVDNTSDATKNSTTATLTNKRITPRTLPHSDTSPIAVNSDSYDVVIIAELSQDTTFNAPSGTPTEAQYISYEVCTTTQRTLTFVTTSNGFSNANNIALPTKSNAGSCAKYTFFWRVAVSRWVFSGSTQTTDRGTSGECLVSNGANQEPSWQTCPGGAGGGSGIVQLPVGAVSLPTSNAARIDASENNTRLLFDASTSQCAWWEFVIPDDYASTPVFKMQYSMTSATSGGVSIDVYVAAITPGDAVDVNSDNYAATNNCDDTAVPAAAGRMEEISCTLTNFDSGAAGDLAMFKVCRATNDSSDTATGDMEMLRARFTYVK